MRDAAAALGLVHAPDAGLTRVAETHGPQPAYRARSALRAEAAAAARATAVTASDQTTGTDRAPQASHTGNDSDPASTRPSTTGDATQAAHLAQQQKQEPGARPARQASLVASPTLSAEDVRSPSPGGERLNKYLARTGVCSRREADDWIGRGWIHINGKPADLGQKVMPGDQVEVQKAATSQQQARVTILLHKPVGYVSGQAEDGHQPATVLIDAGSRWVGDTHPRRFHPAQLRGLAAAGRLDIDSTGLLVLTQDGRVARQLIGADSATSKEYLVRVRYGEIEQNVQAAFPAEGLALLRHGLSLDGRPLKPAEVTWQNPEQLRFVLHEGRYRQIRRMCEAVGLHVTGLKRIRIGQVMLGQLPPGQWRYLGADEHF